MEINLKEWIINFLEDRENIILYSKILEFIGVKYKYDQNLLYTVRNIIRWLRGSKDISKKKSLCYFYPKRQTPKYRKYYHEAAEELGLNHFTIEITNNRYFCVTHKKYCSKWRNGAEDRTYDSDHECSDHDKYDYDDDDFHCEAILKIYDRRIIYIANIDIKTKEDLMFYIEKNGDLEHPPFRYSY